MLLPECAFCYRFKATMHCMDIYLFHNYYNYSWNMHQVFFFVTLLTTKDSKPRAQPACTNNISNYCRQPTNTIFILLFP